MTDWNSASYAAIQASMERTRAQCRCEAKRDEDCWCADELRDRQRDQDMMDERYDDGR